MNNLAFGFRYNGEPVDMLDNEYLTLSLVHEYKKDQYEKEFQVIGLDECSHNTHLNEYYKKKTTANKFGTVYCSKQMSNSQSKLYGNSQIGYPTKRIKFGI